MTVLSSTDRDNAEKKVKSSYFDLPAMNVFVAFPQATPASKFPTCTSDYYHFSELLTPEEQAVRKRVREFMEKEVAPIMTEKAEFPFHIIPKLGALGVVGGSIKVMAVLATSQPMPLQQQRYLALMQAVGLLIWSLAWRRLWSSLALEKLLELKLLMGGACPWILFLHMFIVP
ncbi:unnamed protein product [Brassica napus]|uniref:(rape) hypothetical protein n=1 Tax=Brassica napus TaxID=3708 RepID=A0A816PE33_BRANA|nr:unnamed protein product [Brassica napus]